MRRRSLTAVVALVFALLAGAALAQQTFRIAIGVDPDSLDPAQGTTTTVDNVLDYMVQPLVTIDESGKLVPDLATSWSTSADGKTLTFDLRQGVTFQDGTPFDASAVKWNLERLLDPKVRVPRRGQLTVIDSVEVVDAHTVRLHLKEPSPALVGAMSQTTAAMLSPASVDKEGNSYANIVHPVGTGPYVYTSRQKGTNVVVSRFDGYWGEKPYYDKVVFQIVPEATTRESLLLAGQVDLIILPPTSDLPALQNNPRVKVLFGPSDRTIFIAINTSKKVLDDKRVREALNYAVDKQAIIKGVLFGAADPMDAPMAPSIFGYQKIGAYPYDPEKAKQLLQEAGVDPSQITLHLISPTGRYVQDFPAAQAIANYIRDIGFKVDVRTMDWPTYVGTITKPQAENTTELHLLGWAPAFMDASQQMQQFDCTQSPPNGLATSFYCNQDVQKLLQQASSEVDVATREKLYQQASKIIWDDAPWIFLWVQRFPMAYQANLTGIGGLPNEKFYALYARPAN
ncbi:MAG: ABC transporter substrate-binding protein [Deinococcales bacterium]